MDGNMGGSKDGFAGRLEVIEGRSGRRRWSDAEKARIASESFRPGARVAEVDVAICLPTPPEVIAGSTRMGAGTAQKIALNMLSTMMAVRLGHVHDGFMVNVIADNRKLRRRARGIVEAITGVPAAEATAALDASHGSVKPAILLAAGAGDLAQANQMLTTHKGHLRPALAALKAMRRG
jgi:N-acetylmuramic acid 6-phosphate etherase